MPLKMVKKNQVENRYSRLHWYLSVGFGSLGSFAICESSAVCVGRLLKSDSMVSVGEGSL